MSQKTYHRVTRRLPWSMLLLAASAMAQDGLTEEEQEEEIRRYTVEMIIFAYDDSASAGTEIFVPDEPPAFEVSDNWLPLDDAAEFDDPELQEIDVIVRQRQENIDQRLAFVMLQEKEFELQEILTNLDELNAYVPLMHFGWTQPTYPLEDTKLRPLTFFGRPPEGLEGNLSLYLSRYLHLAVDLEMDESTLEKFREAERLAALSPDEFANDDLNAAEQDSPMRDSFSFGDGIGEIAFGDTSGENLVTYPVRYRIDEDRIFRNGELRYYDHPRFGILAKVTRYEEPEPEDEELLGFDGE